VHEAVANSRVLHLAQEADFELQILTLRFQGISNTNNQNLAIGIKDANGENVRN
jgi:hypothetical protein